MVDAVQRVFVRALVTELQSAQVSLEWCFAIAAIRAVLHLRAAAAGERGGVQALRVQALMLEQPAPGPLV